MNVLGRKAWCYVIGFPDGLVKFGSTFNPRLRMAEHRRTSGDISWFYFFAETPHRYYNFAIERRACVLAEEGGAVRRHGSFEWFVGIDPSQAILWAHEAEDQVLAEFSGRAPYRPWRRMRRHERSQA